MKALNLRTSHYAALLFSKRSLSFSSETQLRKPLAEKTFFKSNSKDGLISRLCEGKKYKEAMGILCDQKRLREAVQLLSHIERPSALIYSTLLQRCLQERSLEEGRHVHNHIRASGFVPGLFISNRFIDIYAKCGSLGDAQKMFDEMPEKACVLGIP